jgi:hypothetical protein
MEDSKKKPIMIGVIVVCLAAAGLIFYSTQSGGGGGINDIPDDKMTWVKCNNPDCKAEYQISEKEYFKSIEERLDPMAMSAPPLVCKECGKDSVYRAEKCTNPDCGVVFFRGAVPNDFADRCPECKRSETEEIRKRRLSGG